MLGTARTAGRRKKTKSLDSPSMLSIRNLSKQQSRALPSVFPFDSATHTESQIIGLSSHSKPQSRMQSSHNLSSVRGTSDSMNKSYSFRSVSMSARKPTVEYHQTFDMRSLNLQSDMEQTAGDLKSVEAAKAKHKEMLVRSREVAVSYRQELVEGKREFVLLAEVLTAFESVGSTVGGM